MITQRAVWTLLPNGRLPDGRVRASVLVSPRLQLSAGEAPELSSFPDWLDWPAKIAGAVFTVESTGGEILDAERLSEPESGVWQAIFPGDTYVEPWSFDAERAIIDRTVMSYPVARVAEMLEQVYGRIGANAADTLPSRDQLSAFLLRGSGQTATLNAAGRGVRPEPLTPEQVRDTLRIERQRLEAIGQRYPKEQTGGIMEEPGRELDLLAAYHAPLNEARTGEHGGNWPNGYESKFPGKENPMRHAKWRTARRADFSAIPDFRREIDFHRIVASLGQFPALNRLCGLAIDLAFEPPSDTPNATLFLRANWSPSNAGGVTTQPDIAPRIVTRTQGQRFRPALRFNQSPISDGYLRLEGDDYALVQMDVDGGGMKLKNTVENFRVSIRADYDDEEPGAPGAPEAGLPSLRTQGLMLAERRRDLGLTALLTRAGSMQSQLEGSGTPPTLYAEDVIRGYRVDVRDMADGRWRSLFFRDSRYVFLNDNSDRDVEREEGMARAAGGGSADGANPDILKLHESLAAWTGWSLAAPEPGNLIKRDDSHGSEQEDVPEGLPLRVRHKVSRGTLPRLRFGHEYQIRVRLADLSGSGPEFQPDDVQPGDAVSPPVMFRRHEPIEPPALALVRGDRGGQSLADGESMSTMAIRTYNETPDLNTVPIADKVRRHVAAPRVGHRFAEMHGMLDTGPGGIPDPAKYTLLRDTDSPIEQVEIARTAANGLTEEESYAIADPDFTLPYLPDPLAIEAAIRIHGLPNVDPSVVYTVPLYAGDPLDEWPNARPFKIVGAEETGQPSLRPGPAREFVVPMAKAERARVWISFKVPRDKLAMMAVWEMIQQRGGEAGKRTSLRQSVLDGKHWMFTPWRTVEIVHAVQKPLVTPVMDNLTINRRYGDATARLTVINLPIDCRSTARLDAHGEWVDPVDDPSDLDAAEGPVPRAQAAHAFKKEYARTEHRYGRIDRFQGDHLLPDTRYRRIRYDLTATTRYKEFFEEALRTAADPSRIEVTSPKRTGWAPNAAAPPPPEVLYVIPTFGWARSQSGSDKRSMRLGGGLRVYLDRPWMTTGFTEMLGVVLKHPPAPNRMAVISSSRVDSKVTRWGGDPLRPDAGGLTSEGPSLPAFPLRKTSGPLSLQGTGLPEEEGSDLPPGDFPIQGLLAPGAPPAPNAQSYAAATAGPFDVAPHEVGYDAERKLWYCDIVIRPPASATFPFVRLALSRYNPFSTPGAHLSEPVLTEFQQLVPDRLVIVSLTRGGAAARVAVHGVGPAEAASPRFGLQPFEARTEILRAGEDPDLGWVEAEAELPSDPTALRPGAARINPDAIRNLQVRSAQAQPQRAETGQTTQNAQIAQSPIGRALQQAQTSAQISATDRDSLEQALLAGDAAQLQVRPDLLLQIAPPLLWETEIGLPDIPPNGGRRRLVVTELETHQREPDDMGAEPLQASRSAARPIYAGRRVIYMDAVEI